MPKNIPKNIHQLFKDGKTAEIFSEFESQYTRAKSYSFVEGGRKASSTAQKNNKDEMLIHLLAEKGEGKDFQRCYNFGKTEDINARTKDGLSPIHYAIKSNNIPRIKHIVHLGANILGLNGGIAGLADYAVKPETKEFLNSDEFNANVNIFKDKAERIVGSTPEKELKRNDVDKGKLRQSRLTSIFSSQRRGAEQQEEQQDQDIAEERELDVQLQQHVVRDLIGVRGAFRSAATLLREEQRNGRISAVNNIAGSSSSVNSLNDRSNGSANRDLQESEDIQEALRRSMMPEYHQVNYMGSSSSSSSSYEDDTESDRNNVGSSSSDHSNTTSSSVGSNIFLRNLSQQSSQNIANSTQSTLIVDSQVLGSRNPDTPFRRRASSEESGHTTGDNLSYSVLGDESSIDSSKRSFKSSSSIDSDSDLSSEEGDRNKRRADNSHGSPSRVKRADHKNTPKKDKSPEAKSEANKENESFVNRLLVSRSSRDNSIDSDFAELQDNLNASQEARVVFRRQQVTVRDAANSPMRF